jgi:lanthionine-containing peptide SapB
MTLLEMQSMDLARDSKDARWGGGGGGGSHLSVLLCDSTASIMLCL